jgi:flagellar motility protein MotE (MotC chaperone)
MKKLPQLSGLKPRLVLPLLILCALGAVSGHLNNVFAALEDGSLLRPVNEAQAAPETATPPAAAADEGPSSAQKADQAAAKDDAKDDGNEMSMSGSEMAVVKQLADRRKQLDDRAAALDARESLIRVAEQRVDQKMKEMETLRTQVQALVNQASGAQAAQIENLVKIYETMKPKEAAKIFETLDMPVLLGVVQKMKPTRVAAVMAEMAPEKAKEVTVALTKQDQLPQVK